MATYYTYDQQTKRLAAAPRAIKTATGITFNAPASEYAKLGAYPRNDAYTPDGEPPEGKMWSRTGGYTLRDGAWCADYEAVDIPPPAPRVFSKLKVVAALMQAGVWDAVKGYIEQEGLYDLYLAAQEFAEDNEYFTRGRAALQSALGWTDAQVEAVLAASVKEGGA